MAAHFSALEIVNQMRNGVYQNNPRLFFLQLREAIGRDYQERGRCEYVEKLANGSLSTITKIEYSVLLDWDHFAERRQWADTSGDTIPYIYGEDISGKRWNYHWQNGLEPWSGKISLQEKAIQVNHKALLLFNQRKQEQQVRSSPAPFVGGRTIPISYPETPTRPAVSNIQRQEASSAEQILTQARAEAERIRTSAQTDANRIWAQAQDEANRIRAEAQTLRSQAEAEQQEVQRQKQELELVQASLQQRQAQFEETIAAQADQLTDQFLWNNQQRLLEEWNRSRAEENLRDERAAAELSAAKEAMCTAINDLKGTWRRELEETTETLLDLQNQLDSRLRSWQSALYPRELRPLAGCYTQLYRIVHNDHALTDAISALGQLPSEAQKKTVEYLQQRIRSLTVLQGNLEKALNKLGLYLYFPAEGSAYDDVLQAPADEGVEDPYRMVVNQCQTPGVIHRTGGELEEGEPVIPAIVTLKPREGA